MRVVFSGGGTAGHINPALSIAKAVLKHEPDSEILFVGTPGGMENALVTKEGFRIEHVEVKGFRRKFTLENIKIAMLAATSVGKAKKILNTFRPDVVVGTGGYVSWPVLRAASKMHIPTVIHEQNAVPGLTTKKLAHYADTVCLSFEETKNYLSCGEKKTVLCGNPVNPQVGTLSRTSCRSELGIFSPFLLSYGGSLGARVVNETMFCVARDYSMRRPIFHTHAFGAREYKQWMEKESREHITRFGNVRFTDYIYDMPRQMAAADLVVCRAGAITLAELALMGKPAILIPSPNVTNNHQVKNAMVYHEKGAAVMVEEKDITPQKICAIIDSILQNPARLAEMSANMKRLAHPGADEAIYQEIKKLVKK